MSASTTNRPIAVTAPDHASTSSPSSSPRSRSLLTVEDALKSCICAWLVARDSVLWDLNMSGVGGDDEFLLKPVQIEDGKPGIEQMNRLRSSALYFASKLSSKKDPAEVILDRFLAQVLADSTPAVNLHVESIPESF